MARHAHVLALVTVCLGGVLFSGCVTNNASDSIPDTPLPAQRESVRPSDGDGSASGQSVEAACGRLQAAIQEAEPAIQEGLAEVPNDPSTGIQALQSFSADFAQTRDELTNPEVRKVADDAAVALDGMIADLESAVAEPGSFDLTAFVAEVVPEVREQLAAIGTVCEQ